MLAPFKQAHAADLLIHITKWRPQSYCFKPLSSHCCINVETVKAVRSGFLGYENASGNLMASQQAVDRRLAYGSYHLMQLFHLLNRNICNSIIHGWKALQVEIP